MSPLRCAVLILALIAACAGASKAKGVTKATVYYDSTKDAFSLKEGVLDHSGAAYGVYLEEVNLDGWGKLNVTTNDSYPNHVQAIAAGYLEGAITQLRIWQNYVNQQYSWPPEVVAALIANYDWMTAMAHDLGDSEYWRHVDYMMRQLYGLSLGYASVAPPSQNLTLLDLLIMNADGDMGDVQTALAVQNNASWVRDRRGAVDRALQDGCSGLVRWTSDDLFVSQTTWTEYNDALRILKSYHLHFKGVHTAAHSIVFSSYPGRLWSSDDFYVMSSGLAVIETTSSVFNNDLWNFYTNQSVYTWINTMVTNRLAVNAFNWTNIFALYSSGTYTNQWLIVDYNKYKAGARTLQQETLMLMEAIPGYTMSLDATGLLAQHGYVGSYNTWYIDFIYNATGYPQMAAQYGNWFTYNKTPRALIFARNATQVASLKHMHHLMTYNNFEHDPLSGGYAENAIAARSDLMPNVSVPFSALGTRCHGAIDSKVTSAAFVPLLQITAYGAPTHHQQPVFAWANATICNALNVSHIGMPESYPFDWITFSPAYFNPYV